MKRYKYILLDWDGNLARTLDVWFEAKRRVFAKRNLSVTDADIVSCFGAVQRFVDFGVTDMEAAIAEMDQYAKQHLPQVALYPDAQTVLEALHQDSHKLALITTSLRENVQPILRKFNMDHYFDALVTNKDTERHKPDPQPLEKALELLGGTKDRAVMIGDSDKDIGAAVNAGIDSILFYPPEHARYYDLSELRRLQPTHVVEDFRHVLDIV